MSKNSELTRIIDKFSWGLLDSLSSIILYQIALLSASFSAPGHTSVSAHKALHNSEKIYQELAAHFKPSQLKRALRHLHRKGLIANLTAKLYEIEITKSGLKQLQSALPTYRLNRPWDKRVYLVSYDIDENFRFVRDQLRQYLCQTHCAPLHESLYLSVYNPKGLLKTWSQEYLKNGNILVSDLGPDGSLGEQPLEELVATAYKLDSINQEYADFLKLPANSQALFCYQKILSQDPQLPFELLPNWWLGDKAWHRYRNLLKT